MKVIAGEFKGRPLRVPKGTKIRPTSDMVKEALFNILGQMVEGASFLELFAGSGSIGIEAKSRGAGRVVLVENNRLCLKAIEQNLRSLDLKYEYGLGGKFDSDIAIIGADSEAAISGLAKAAQQFDIVFLDPPYHEEKLKNCLLKLTRCDILKPRSLAVAEHNKKEILPQQLSILKVISTKVYGDTALSFYQKASGSASRRLEERQNHEKNSHISRYI